MLTDDVTFTLDAGGIDRRALLEAAASELQALSGHYGDSAEQEDSPESRLARELSGEFAELPHFPDLLEITAADFSASGREIPVSFAKRSAAYSYFWMRIPLALRTRLDWAFSRLELGLEFNPGEIEPGLRPTAYAILPHRRFQSILQSRGSIEVSLDGNFELSAAVPAIPLPGGAAAAEAKVGAGAGLGLSTSIEWRLQKARIDHTETGLTRVFWRIDGTRFFAEDVPAPIVVLQVPRAADHLEVVGAMQAYRHLSLLNAGLVQMVEGLPRRMREFFKGGSPIRDQATWNLDSVWDDRHA